MLQDQWYAYFNLKSNSQLFKKAGQSIIDYVEKIKMIRDQLEIFGTKHQKQNSY